MSIITELALSLALSLVAGASTAAESSRNAPVYGFGSPATADELNIFVSPLPDGRGLPQGSGTVAHGKEVYEAQCVACHGAQLQGGPGDRLIGGRGTLVNDSPTKAPVKTVESYWPYATTLFDYIKRAMPLYQPASLSNDDVYALVAYILSEAKIVAADASLDAASLPRVRMPNRDGFVADRRPDAFLPVAKTPHSN